MMWGNDENSRLQSIEQYICEGSRLHPVCCTDTPPSLHHCRFLHGTCSWPDGTTTVPDNALSYVLAAGL